MKTHKYSILIVDDERSILNSLHRLFRKEGYNILTAESGEQGLKVLSNNRIDLIISDQRMPGMSGVEFLRRAKERYPDIIRIILSGYVDIETITSGVNEGNIYKFILKPWNDEELKIAVARALEQHDLIIENRRLTEMIKRQNEELKILNQKLQREVEKKTQEVIIADHVLLLAQEILENLPISVVGIDKEGMIAQINNTFLRIYGSNARYYLGLRIDEVFPDDICKMIIKTIQTKQTQKLSTKSYKGFSFSVECTPLSGRFNINGAILLFHNIQEDRGKEESSEKITSGRIKTRNVSIKDN